MRTLILIINCLKVGLAIRIVVSIHLTNLVKKCVIIAS
jgi:hypothetical protein